MAGVTSLDSMCVGEFLDSCIERIGKTIDTTVTKPDHREYSRVGMDYFLAASSLKAIISAEDLPKTVKELDCDIGDSIHHLRDLKDIFTNDGEDTGGRVALVQSKIKGKDDLPFVSSVQPQFIAVRVNHDTGKATTTKVTVVFSGRFPYGTRQDCATLTFGEKEFQPNSSSTITKLKFDIEIASDAPGLKKHAYAYIPASLKVWYSGGLLSWNEAIYKILLGIAPTASCSIEAFYKTPSKTITRVSTTSAIPINNSDRVQYFQASSGWTIVPDSIQPIFTIAPKPSEYIKTSVVNNQLECTFIDNSAAQVQILYKETQVVPEEERAEIYNDLGWGGVKVFEPKENERIAKVVLKTMDGRNLTWVPGTKLIEPDFEVNAFQGSVQVKTAPLDLLNAPVVRALAPSTEDSDSKEESK